MHCPAHAPEHLLSRPAQCTCNLLRRFPATTVGAAFPETGYRPELFELRAVLLSVCAAEAALLSGADRIDSFVHDIQNGKNQTDHEEHAAEKKDKNVVEANLSVIVRLYKLVESQIVIIVFAEHASQIV